MSGRVLLGVTAAEAMYPAFWEALFQLIVLGIVGLVANIIYRRFRDRSTARQELLNDIDGFGVQLYKPRKMYQVMIDNPDQLLARICTPQEREVRRLQAVHQALQELVEATGRFRTLQVSLIGLYGFQTELMAHYLAIWYYLKDLRGRMEKGESLYLPGDRPDSGDDFYRLFDAFRYRVSVARFAPPVRVVQPPPDVLAELHRAGRAVYEQYFSQPAAAEPHGGRDGLPAPVLPG